MMKIINYLEMIKLLGIPCKCPIKKDGYNISRSFNMSPPISIPGGIQYNLKPI